MTLITTTIAVTLIVYAMLSIHSISEKQFYRTIMIGSLFGLITGILQLFEYNNQVIIDSHTDSHSIEITSFFVGTESKIDSIRIINPEFFDDKIYICTDCPSNFNLKN